MQLNVSILKIFSVNWQHWRQYHTHTHKVMHTHPVRIQVLCNGLFVHQLNIRALLYELFFFFFVNAAAAVAAVTTTITAVALRAITIDKNEIGIHFRLSCCVKLRALSSYFTN